MKRLIPICALFAMVFCLALAGLSDEGKDTTKAVEKKEAPGKSDTLKWAEENFHYVGEKKCKMCHREHFKSWSETPHAKAWAALKPEEQKKAECVECHITGMTKADSMLVNVACEACHGPGSKYKTKKTMEDPKLAAEKGLLPVTEATCVRCHNEKSPTFKEFKYAEALKVGVHSHPEEEKEEKE